MNQYSHQLNQRVSGLDLNFAGSLHQHNCGDGYWDLDWCIVAEVEEGELLLQKNQLTVQADPQRHLQTDRPYNVGDRVNLKLPKNRVEGDRYVAVGNAGLPGNDCCRIPFALNIDTVMNLMQRITVQLNQLNLPFTLAVFYDPLDYPHEQGAILTVNESDRNIAEAIGLSQ